MYQPLRRARTVVLAFGHIAVFCSFAALTACQAPAAEFQPAANTATPAELGNESLAPTLLAAARAGDMQQVRAALAAGAPVNVQDAQGNSPLLLATMGNHIEVARSLLLDGANPNLKNAQSDSAYLLAGAQGRLEILRMTLSYGADLKSLNRFGGTALIPACERGHVEAVKALIAAGVAVDHVNRLGWACLLEAIVLADGGPSQQNIVAQLIAARANLNLADRQGMTPLAHARERQQLEIVRLLEAAGAR